MDNANKLQSHIRSTLWRWLDIAILAFFGATVYALGGHKVASWLDKYLFDAIFGEDYILGLAIGGLMVMLAIVLLNRATRIQFGHFRYFFRYPPLPAAVLLGLLMAWALLRFQKGYFENQSAILKELAFAGIFYTLIWIGQATWVWINKKTPPSSALTNGETQDYDETQKLKLWLSYEEAIADQEFDFFDYKEIADRLLDRLAKSGATVALQGEFGSGKSSICNIAKAEAKRRELPWIFVFASCWGFKEAVRAQKEVLEAILREVEKEADCLAIKQLPNDYIEALSSRIGWSTLFQIGGVALTPLEQLQRLSPVLNAIGKRVIVVIEDVDRTGQAFDIGQIQSMLMQFRKVDGLSFVLAISPSQQIDFIKLCDYLELVPAMEQGKVLQLIHKTREISIKEHPPGIMLSKLEPLVTDDDDYSMYAGYLSYSVPWQMALCSLLNRPRLLKHALRRVYELWPRLKGEIHFDDLISISALRAGAPEAFAFLCEKYQFFSATLDDSHHQKDETKTRLKEELVEEWKIICNGKRFDQRSAAAILEDIDPSAGILSTRNFISRGGKTVQSMSSSKRRDVYARRLFTGNLKGGEIADQAILSWMQHPQANSTALRGLAEAITNSNAAGRAFEDFASPMEFNQDFLLLTEVYALTRERYGSHAHTERGGSIGFFAPGRRKFHDRPDNFEAWLIPELSKCIPKNLRFLNDIYYYWLGGDRYSYEERLAPRQNIVNVLQESWESVSLGEIAEGFDPTFIYVLFHLMFTSDFQRQESVPLGKIEDWAWSGPLLHKAAQTNPDTILPQVLIALNTDSSRGGELLKYELDMERLEKWFGQLASSMLELCGKGFPLHEDITEQSKYLLKQAIEKAKEALERIHSTSSISFETEEQVLGQTFTIERPNAEQHSSKLQTEAANVGVVDWLLACPEKDWFQPLPSESTDSL